MSIDLSQNIGLPANLLDNNRLEFGKDVDLEKMSVRNLSDLAIVAADADLKLPDEPAYYMYRDVHKAGDEKKIAENDLRFDLTVVPSAMLGEEYIKTSGHYHPVKPGTAMEYPELYYVVRGQATYLMQKHEQNGAISDVIVARVPAGNAIMVPPFYGHVTINETDEVLVMANWVGKNFSSMYGDYEEKRGGAYYLKLQNPNNKLQINGGYEKNVNYGEVPEIREAESMPLCLKDFGGVPVYDYLKQVDKIDLVVNPEKHLEDFEIDKLFRFIQ